MKKGSGPRLPNGRYVASPLEQRFWQAVSKGNDDECWLWREFKRRGYGSLTRGPGLSETSAHRVSWELHYGPIPDNLFVLHRCDNPPCVNPKHLFLGTQADNLADARNKGKYMGPERKLTAKQIIEIRERYRADHRGSLRATRNGVKQSDLAVEYGVSQGRISYILRHKKYKLYMSR